MKLVQKRFLKGIREFEIVDDIVKVRLKTRFMEEKASVMLTILNPEPEINEPFLEFHSRVKCSPLLSLWIDKPNAAEFNAFVDELKRRAREERSMRSPRYFYIVLVWPSVAYGYYLERLDSPYDQPTTATFAA